MKGFLMILIYFVNDHSLIMGARVRVLRCVNEVVCKQPDKAPTGMCIEGTPTTEPCEPGGSGANITKVCMKSVQVDANNIWRGCGLKAECPRTGHIYENDHAKFKCYPCIDKDECNGSHRPQGPISTLLIFVTFMSALIVS